MAKYKLLEVFGIELEYMVVDKDSLNVLPITDQLFQKVSGSTTNDISGERVDWSNELVLHVVEFKNKKPEPKILPLISHFQNEVKRANTYLQSFNAILLPGAVHPWMSPDLETKLWPHENKIIYKTYDRVFGCKGHGWSNLQSLHINISFANDQEFEKLHAAIRFILPLIPALSSSSPIIDGSKTEYSSNRLKFYLQNQRRIPSILGKAIPEPAWSEQEYQEKILQPMYNDIAPYDTECVLQEEWLNSRGAIPKFERGCIEIRLADIQEAPVIDLAIAHFWISIIKLLTEGNWITLEKLKNLDHAKLRAILDQTVLHAENAQIEDSEYLALFEKEKSTKANILLNTLSDKISYAPEEQVFQDVIKKLLSQGSLSTRLCRSLNKDYSRENLLKTYKNLATCLQEGIFFEG